MPSNTNNNNHYKNVSFWLLIILLPLYSILYTIIYHIRIINIYHYNQSNNYYSTSEIPNNETSSSNPAIRKTNKKQKYELRIDVISTGCIKRQKYLQGQYSTWGTHPSIRNFIKLTEFDDTISNCTNKINIPNYLSQCKKRRIKDSFFMTTLRSRMDWTEKELSTNKNPEGWLCAQRRPGIGFKKLIERMNVNGSNNNNDNGNNISQLLPDYLLLADDDTYINIDLLQSYISTRRDLSPNIPLVYSGCLLERTRKKQINIAKTWYVPYGGYGLIFSRGSLERLYHPLYCNTNQNKSIKEDDITAILDYEKNHKNMTMTQYEQLVCHRIVKDNLLGEKDLYKTGMSISDLAYELSSSKYYCMHSDWLTMYLINYYYLSNLVMSHNNDNNTKLFNRIHPYRDNQECKYNTVSLCNASISHICHYQTPDSMKTLISLL